MTVCRYFGCGNLGGTADTTAIRPKKLGQTAVFLFAFGLKLFYLEGTDMCSIMGYTAKDIRLEDLRKGFDKTVSRGPDMSRTLERPQVGSFSTASHHGPHRRRHAAV